MPEPHAPRRRNSEPCWQNRAGGRLGRRGQERHQLGALLAHRWGLLALAARRPADSDPAQPRPMLQQGS
eukprot:3878389-Lingulodinium_polyedra.AAC.1